ncbi:MAG: hypothetical protein JWO58_1340 [Chitinophagaceae bacterium]|nr:hypothetical protein [Chitinophagaceae bacterium]
MRSGIKRTARFFSVFIAMLMLSGLFFSCARYIEEAAPAPIIWLGSRQNSNDTITVENGYAYLSTYHSISASGTSIISNNKLKGDFEIKISYSFFVASGTNSYSDQLEFNVAQAGSRNPLVAGFLTNEKIYLQDSTGGSSSKTTTNRAGEFYVKRMGSEVYSWIRAGSDSLFLSRTNYSMADLTLEAMIYSWDNTSNHTSVHIDDVLIIGGGNNFPSDHFDQNKINVIQ